MNEHKIKLGDKVRDIVSGYEGIVVARSEFMNGCIQYSVCKKLKKGEKPSALEGDPSIDEISLKVIQKRAINSKEYEREDNLEKNKIKRVDKLNGGPTRLMKSMRGY